MEPFNVYPQNTEAYARKEPTDMAEPEIPSGRFSSAMGARITDLPRKTAIDTTTSMIRMGQIIDSFTGRRITTTAAAATIPRATVIIFVEDLKT